MEGILHSLETNRGYADITISNKKIASNYDFDSIDQSFIAFSNALRQFVTSQTSSPSASASNSTSNRATSSSSTTSHSTAKWLYEQCSLVPSPLPTLQFAQAVLSAIKSSHGDESKMQSSLFELFGEGEKSIDILFEVMGKAEKIRSDNGVTDDLIRSVAEEKGDVIPTEASASSTTTSLDRMNQLRSEAYEAADRANALRINHSNNTSSRATHSVTRASDKEAEKMYKRAVKQASTALKKARDEGALTESDELFLKARVSKDGGLGELNAMEASMLLRDEEAMLYNSSMRVGLDGMNLQQIQDMKRNLLPEGTKEYNDQANRGLPRGTEREVKSFYEKVTIPAPIREKSMLRSRINLDEVLGSDSDERMAFEGTKSLNPMQSTVFDAAYNSRENLLICAPTGAGELSFCCCRPLGIILPHRSCVLLMFIAGKTNVAMLTVVSHLRDVGLIGTAYHDGEYHYDNGPVTTGKKIVYIAPMKALAQEVQEKFSSKLKCLGIIVKELTGDMQLSRAEAEAAHVSDYNQFVVS